MNTITIPIKEYKQSIQMQKSILSRLDLLQKAFFESGRDEVNSEYLLRLAKIEKGLSSGKGIRFKNKNEIKKFFRSL